MPDRLRILFAIGWLGAGGSERQLLGILKHLDRTRFEPHLYLLSRSGEFLSDVPDDVPVLEFSESDRKPLLNLPGRIYRRQVDHLAQTLKDGRFDAVYDRTSMMTLVAGPAADRARVPRVSSIVCDPSWDLLMNHDRFRRRKQRVLTRSYRSAARVVANSNPLRDAAITFYRLQPEKTETVFNGFDFREIRRLAEIDEHELEADRFHIVTAGRFQHQKGIEDLLDAMYEVVHKKGRKEALLHLVGSGPEEETLRYLVDELELAGHVRFTGFMANPFSLFRQADLFCLASLYEGSPNVLVEAMSCGLPVLSTHCEHGPGEILEDGRLGELVPIGSWEAMSEEIEDAMVHPEKWQSRAAEAALSVADRFDINRTTKELEAILEAVAR